MSLRLNIYEIWIRFRYCLGVEGGNYFKNVSIFPNFGPTYYMVHFLILMSQIWRGGQWALMWYFALRGLDTDYNAVTCNKTLFLLFLMVHFVFQVKCKPSHILHMYIAVKGIEPYQAEHFKLKPCTSLFFTVLAFFRHFQSLSWITLQSFPQWITVMCPLMPYSLQVTQSSHTTHY